MAETESQHRRDMERMIVEAGVYAQASQFSEARFGQICALMISIAAMAFGSYTALNGHDVTGGVLGLSGVGGIVTTFILGRSAAKAKEPDQPPQKPLSKQAARRLRSSR